ncbi:hypothetical protein E9840_06720 [Tissierella creatinini]|nr:hypothetical protein E9840_06720 [Tissierella creatinini]TJX61510.1 hypothetical protein E8P77_18375 [Soehngenia saccharolytica]
MNPKFKNRDGVVLPLVALLMVVLLGFAALAVDAGSMYLDRREMTTAADAGALAGAKELSDSNGSNVAKAKQIATEVSEQNGADVGEVEADVKTVGGMQVIEVRVNKTKDTYFAKIFGINSTSVGARSVATWGYVKDFSGGSIMPLFSFDKDFALGNAVLKAGKLEAEVVGGSVVINNNYGYLEFDGGMSIIKNVLAANNYTIPGDIVDEIMIGGVLEGETGNKQSLIGAIETRMDKALAINVGDDGKIAARKQFMSGLIPIIDYDEFIAMNVTIDYDKDGNIKKIKVKTPLDLPISYFAIFEIQDIVVDNKNNGSSHALDKTTYEKVTSIQKYGSENKGTIIGKYTQSYVNVEIEDINNNNQDNPNPGGYAAKWFKLIEADYIGD